MADIDNAMRFCCGYPAGPFAVIDEIGPESVRDALAARFAETGDHLHRPADLLERLVAGGSTFSESDAAGDLAAPRLRHDIARAGVVGTGTMASGIVQVFAQAEYEMVFVGRGEDKNAGVTTFIAKALDEAIVKGKLDEDGKAAVLGRVTGATSREDLAEVDLVVEAIAEDLELKLFRDLDRICKPGAILAATTSSLPITELAKATGRPEVVIGMHFFNPAAIMKLVEVVTTDLTSAEVDETVRALTAQVGKVAVSCGDRRIHRQRAAVPLPQRRGQAGRDRRRAHRDRHRDQGAREAPRRRRQRRVAGHPERAVRRVRGAGLRTGCDPRAPRRRRPPRPRDRQGIPHPLIPDCHGQPLLRPRERLFAASGSPAHGSDYECHVDDPVSEFVRCSDQGRADKAPSSFTSFVISGRVYLWKARSSSWRGSRSNASNRRRNISPGTY